MRESEFGEARGVWSAVQQQWRWLALVLGTVFLLGVVILVIYYSSHVNVRVILSDPAETALLPEYAGLYSSIGVIVLWTAAIVGFVSSRFGEFVSQAHRTFLATYAGIIGFLALDDLFMIHEWGGLILARISGASDIASARSALEALVFALYIFAFVVWMWKYRVRIWNSPWPLLALGGLGFAASIGLDLAPYILPSLENQPLRIETLLAVAEDLFKMVGIGGMAAYGFAMALPPLNHATAHNSRTETK